MAQKVYALIEEYAGYGDIGCDIAYSQVYTSKDDAKEAFRELVDDVKKTDACYGDALPECITDEEDLFSFYEDGNYNDNHYSVRIVKLTVKESR